MSSGVSHRTIAWHGVAAMLVGLALIGMELRYGFLLDSSGQPGHTALLIAGTALSVWGLKEIIAGWWPRLRSRRSSQVVKHRFMLPVEGQVYAVIMTVLFAGSLLGRSNTLLLVFSMLAGPFVLNGGIVYSMLKRLRVARHLPQRAMAGEPFSVDVALRNPKRWLSVWLMAVRDQVDNGGERLHPEVLFTRVPRRSERWGRYQLRLSQRGRYTFGPIQVNSRFPLGLIERGIVMAEPARILVYPRIGHLSTGWRRKLINATELVSQTQSHAGACDDDLHRIREYRAGDDMRAIHWRTSARMRELMVREFRESRDRRLIVLLDAWQPAQATARDRERFELAVSFVATVALEQIRSSRGGHLFLAVNGREPQQWGGGGPTSVESMLDLLALTQANSQASLHKLLATSRPHRTAQTRTLIVTPRAEGIRGMSQSAWEQAAGSIAVLESPQVVIADAVELSHIFTFE